MKRFINILAILCLFFSLTAPALLADSVERLDLVTDVAGVLSEAQWVELNEWAEELTEEYEIDVIVLIVEQIEGNDPEEYAWAVFDYYGMGYGEDQSTVMLMLATVSRKVSVVAQGFGNIAFTDYGKDTILDDYLVPQLRNNNWVAAVYAFMDKVEEYLELADAGKPFDIIIPQGSGGSSGGTSGGYEEDRTWMYVICLLLPLIIAIVMCEMWAGQMKTARIQRDATSYITAAGLNLTEQTDVFSHRTESRRTIQSSSSSSGGGGRSGGTTVSSSGRSGSSRSF